MSGYYLKGVANSTFAYKSDLNYYYTKDYMFANYLDATYCIQNFAQLSDVQDITMQIMDIVYNTTNNSTYRKLYKI